MSKFIVFGQKDKCIECTDAENVLDLFTHNKFLFKNFKIFDWQFPFKIFKICNGQFALDFFIWSTSQFNTIPKLAQHKLV